MPRLSFILSLLLFAIAWWPYTRSATDLLVTESGTVTVSREARFWGRNLALGPNFWELKHQWSTVSVEGPAKNRHLRWTSNGRDYVERAIALSDDKVLLALDMGADARITDCLRYKVVLFGPEGWVDARPVVEVSRFKWIPFNAYSQPATPFPFSSQETKTLRKLSLNSTARQRSFDIDEKLLLCKTQ